MNRAPFEPPGHGMNEHCVRQADGRRRGGQEDRMKRNGDCRDIHHMDRVRQAVVDDHLLTA